MRYKMRYPNQMFVVDALKFDYSSDGIALLREFCGEALGNVSKDRDFYSKGQAKIYKNFVDKNGNKIIEGIAAEGDYIVKSENGELTVVDSDIFLITFHR